VFTSTIESPERDRTNFGIPLICISKFAIKHWLFLHWWTDLKHECGSSVGLFSHCSRYDDKVWSLWIGAWEPFHLGRPRERHRKFLCGSPPVTQSVRLSSRIFSMLWPIWWGNTNQVRQVMSEKLTKSDLMYARSDADHPIVPTTPLNESPIEMNKPTFVTPARIYSLIFRDFCLTVQIFLHHFYQLIFIPLPFQILRSYKGARISRLHSFLVGRPSLGPWHAFRTPKITPFNISKWFIVYVCTEPEN
jgi:hypothetical protein